MAKNPPPRARRPAARAARPARDRGGPLPRERRAAGRRARCPVRRRSRRRPRRCPTGRGFDFLQKSVDAKGWITAQSNIGDYGTDYAYRALIAIVGLGANTPEEAIYPATLVDSSGALLDGSRDYRMIFPADAMPPARYFWSLTMYDLAGYLVDNPIDRYSLGPTHPPLVTRADGSVVVAIQHDPPTEEGVNWLPSPEGSFRLNMRLYGPRKAALNWKWRPPPVLPVP